MHPSGEDLRFLGQLVQAGALGAIVDRTFPLTQIPDAFAYLEQGHAKGKVLVDMA
jgi:alcohol dehydrogenase